MNSQQISDLRLEDVSQSREDSFKAEMNKVAMIAVAWRLVDRAKRKNRYRFPGPAIRSLCFLSWLKPGGHGKPLLGGPITKGMEQFR